MSFFPFFLKNVKIPEEISKYGLDLIRKLNIDSLRAEITLFESSRAFTALDNRKEVTLEDLRSIAPMALRMRRSKFIEDYLSDQNEEENEIQKAVKNAGKTS